MSPDGGALLSSRLQRITRLNLDGARVSSRVVEETKHAGLRRILSPGPEPAASERIQEEYFLNLKELYLYA